MQKTYNTSSSKCATLALVAALLVACAHAAAPDGVKVSPMKLDSPAGNIVWCGINRVEIDEDDTIVLENVETRVSNILFLLADDGSVFVTNTHGAQWTNYTQTLYNQFGEHVIGKIVIREIRVSPADPKTVLLFGSNGTSFVTEGCGKSVRAFTHERRLTNIKLNRMDKNYLLGTVPKRCSQYDTECEDDESTLYVSEDLGRTWVKTLENVIEATWDKLIHFDTVPDYRIIAQHRVFRQGDNNDAKLLSYSDDLYKTKTVIIQNPIQFYQSNFYLFVLTPAQNTSGVASEGYSLKIAPSYLNSYQPKEISLPIKRIRDHSFTVLDTYMPSVYIAINHGDDNEKMTNVYASDFTGEQYTLSLLYAVRSPEGNVDFERVLGSQGTFIANTYEGAQVRRARERGAREIRDAHVQKSAPSSQIDAYKQTKITFNAGGAWHALRAPEKDHTGAKVDCSGECALHIKGRTEQNGNPIYTTDNSPGLILATGNTGLYLERRADELNTYLSRDGGLTWYEVRKYSHLYEIGDHGGLIVMARENFATTEIVYSWDQGLTWDSIKISDKPIEVVDIVTDPSNMQQKFIVFGRRRSEKSNKMIGIVTAIDFTGLHQRVCDGSQDLTSTDSDYEAWTPTNYDGEKCLFGVSMTFIRRKRESKCFNPREFDGAKDFQACPCTEEDWECDFGYYRDADTRACVPASSKQNKEHTPKAYPPPDCVGTYEVSTGYKKVPGSYCDGGVDHAPIQKPCPQRKQSSSAKSGDENDASSTSAQAKNAPTTFTARESHNSGGFFASLFSPLNLCLIVSAVLVYVYRKSVLETAYQVFSSTNGVVRGSAQALLPASRTARARQSGAYEPLHEQEKDSLFGSGSGGTGYNFGGGDDDDDDQSSEQL